MAKNVRRISVAWFGSYNICKLSECCFPENLKPFTVVDSLLTDSALTLV